MSVEQIVKYARATPCNTNPNVLKSLIEAEIEKHGGSENEGSSNQGVFLYDSSNADHLHTIVNDNIKIHRISTDIPTAEELVGCYVGYFISGGEDTGEIMRLTEENISVEPYNISIAEGLLIVANVASDVFGITEADLGIYEGLSAIGMSGIAFLYMPPKGINT